MRWLGWVVLIIGCARPAPPPPMVTARPRPTVPDPVDLDSNRYDREPPPAPPPRSPVVVEASRTLTWTKVLETSFSTRDGRSASELFRYPILAQAIRGDRYAVLAFGEHVSLEWGRLAADAPIAHVDVPLIGSASAAAIALDDHTAKVIALGAPGHAVVATVDLEAAKVTSATELVIGPEPPTLEKVFRVAGAWLIVGFSSGDLMSWTLVDGAARLAAPVMIAARKAGPGFDQPRADMARDGSVVVKVDRLGDGAAPDGLVVARYWRGRWTTLRAPSPTPYGVVAATHTARWLFACLWSCEVRRAVYELGPSDPRRARPLTAFDESWRASRTQMRAIAGGRYVYLFGGQASRPQEELIDGAIVDVTSGVARRLEMPSLDDIPDGAWLPGAAVTLGDRLCLLGGKTARAWKPVHGAACVDPVTLAWQWYASGEVPSTDPHAIANGCEMIGQLDAATTVVTCANRRRSPDGWGGYGWSVWLVRLPEA